MEKLKTFFPLSFLPKTVITELVVSILIQLVVGMFVSFVIGLVAVIPIISFLAGPARLLLGLYITAGVILTFLDYF